MLTRQTPYSRVLAIFLPALAQAAPELHSKAWQLLAENVQEDARLLNSR